jgi:hypothetical protein
MDRRDGKDSHLSALSRFWEFDQNPAFIEFPEFGRGEARLLPQKSMELGRRRLRQNCAYKYGNDQAKQNGDESQATSSPGIEVPRLPESITHLLP